MSQLLNSIRFNSSQTKLNDWSLIKVTGADRENFFQGQVTSDVKSLSLKSGQYSARLNRTGKIQSYMIVGKEESCLYLLCETKLKDTILNDFNKFIIMDDVELELLNDEVHLVFNPELINFTDSFFNVHFFGINAAVTNKEAAEISKTDLNELENIRILNGYPLWEVDVSESFFINDSYLNEVGISYKKGCFLGQETAAKIQNNRGAAYFPVLLELENDEKVTTVEIHQLDKKIGKVNYQIGNYLQASLLRDYRVENKQIEFLDNSKVIKATIKYLPLYKNQTNIEIADELYHLGVDEFQNANIDEAMSFMEKSIAFNPSYADPYESIGVILGRKSQFEEAIEWMDKLLKVNASSVMAHTNKSLFLMKLGRIEEAESEKGLATVKSFAVFGEEAKLKKALQEEKVKKEADMKRREGMFNQVLEIDADDTVALYGLGDIAFYREEFKQAVEYLEKVVQLDEKYSVGYLLLGKSLEATGNLERAMQVYKKGIDIASKRGDMMPANEMQSRLNQLVVSSGLV